MTATPRSILNRLRLPVLLVSLLLIPRGPALSQGDAKALVATDLVGHYPMNGSLADATGNGSNPVISGATFIPDRFNNPSGALFFARRGDAASTRNPLLPVGNHPRSFSLWARVDGYTQGVECLFLAYGEKSNDRYSAIAVDAGTRWLLFTSYGSSVGGLPSGQTLPIGTWYHVAVTFDGTVSRLFVNGSLLDQRIIPVNTAADSILRLGYDDDRRFMLGALDDVRIYRRALSYGEVASLYEYEKQYSVGSSQSPRRATARATVNSGFITGISLTDPGHGYTEAPEIQIIGTGTGGRALAILKDGSIQSVIILASGSGYTEPPVVRIQSPILLPSLAISTSAVRLTLSCLIGQRYQFETSIGGTSWVPAGEPFTADADEVSAVFSVSSGTQLFRVRQLP